MWWLGFGLVENPLEITMGADKALQVELFKFTSYSFFVFFKQKHYISRHCIFSKNVITTCWEGAVGKIFLILDKMFLHFEQKTNGVWKGYESKKV